MGANGKETRQRVLDFMVKYKAGHDGNAPCYREIAAECGMSLSHVHFHIRKLEKESAIQIVDRKIVILGSSWLPPKWFPGKRS